MSLLDSFVLAEIVAMPTGQVRVRGVASGLRQGQAVSIAAGRRCHARVQLVGSGGLRSAQVILPTDSPGLSLGTTRSMEVRLAQWVGWLRAHGVLRLSRLGTGEETPDVPARYLQDPLVCACLGIVLAPSWASSVENPQAPEDWLAIAPESSIAGLLRNAGLSAGVADWLRCLPVRSWEPLGTPLLDVREDPDRSLRIGWWSRTLPRNSYLLGEASLLRVDASDWLDAAVQPLDHGASLWSARDIDRGSACDPAFQFVADPRLDQLFGKLPAFVEQIFANAAHEARHAGADADAADYGPRVLARHLEPRLASLTDSATARILQRTWAFPHASPTLRRSRYLLGGGDPVVRERRHDLAILSPDLAMHVADGFCPRTAKAIDLGRPMLSPLAMDWNVPVWVARRTVGILRSLDSLKATGMDPPDLLALYLEACGPHAPTPGPDDLRFMSELPRYIHGQAEDPNTLAFVRACGREAAISGWSGVRKVLDHYAAVDLGALLLAWWDALRTNAADVLVTSGIHGAPDEVYVEAVFSQWLQSVPLADCIRLALAWSAAYWGHENSIFAKSDLRAPVLFSPQTLVESRVAIRQLDGYAELRDEAAEMRHCIASYHMAVVTGAVLVVSMASPMNDERATVALFMSGDGTWSLKEASGRANRRIEPGSQMAMAIEELLAMLADERRVDATSLDHFRPRCKPVLRLFDYTQTGACLVSRLPSGLAEVALRCFPGDGPLERRIRRAAEKVVSPSGPCSHASQQVRQCS